MFLNVAFRRKENEFDLSPCYVSKVIELEKEQYDYFKNHLLDEHQFLIDNRDLMGVDSQNVTNALLVLCKDREDGYLVDAEGASYARYTAHLPDARKLYNLERYLSLGNYMTDMIKVADECVSRVLKGQEDGRYSIKISNLKQDFKMDSIDENLLLDMLSEREEISIKDCYDGVISVDVMPEYLNHAEQTNLKVISPQELETVLAKHYLWLHDEYGGVQADLRGHYIEDFCFDRRDLCSAVLDGAKFVNCSFWNTSMCSAECAETEFNSCNMMDITAEECNFYGAKFRDCRMDRGVYTHSNFQCAKFIQNDMSGVSLMNSCIADADWVDNETSSLDKRNVVESIEDWQDQGDVPGMQM